MGAEKYEHDEPSSGIRTSEPVSRWSRLRFSFDRFLESLLDVVRDPSLEDRLPSRDGADRDERGEALLLALIRAPRAYQLGAIDVARYALALQRRGDDVYAEGAVHFVLSRLRPDKDGAISIARLRDHLSDVPFFGTIVPALRRLEAHGIVAVSWTGIRPERVELRIPL